MTTAARVGWGRYWKSPGTRTSIVSDDGRADQHRSAGSSPRPAPRRRSAMPLVLTGNPWNRPAATFAAPMPTISWFGSDLLTGPGREGRRGRDRVGERDDGDADRAREQDREVGACRSCGTVNGGNPLGRTPMSFTPCAARSNTITTSMAATTAMRTLGSFGSQRSQDEDQDEREQADGEGRRHRVASSHALRRTRPTRRRGRPRRSRTRTASAAGR